MVSTESPDPAVVPPQPMSRGIHVHEGRTEPQLRVHELRHLQLGFSGFISPYDSGLLGKLVSISK